MSTLMAPLTRSPEPSPTQRRRAHVHLFSHRAADPFGAGSLYGCRCGEVRCAP